MGQEKLVTCSWRGGAFLTVGKQYVGTPVLVGGDLLGYKVVNDQGHVGMVYPPAHFDASVRHKLPARDY